METNINISPTEIKIRSIIGFIVSSLFFLYSFVEIVASSSIPTYLGVLGPNSTFLLLIAILFSSTLLFTVRTPKQFIILILLIPFLYFLYVNRPNPITGLNSIYQIIVIFCIGAAQINIYQMVKLHISALAVSTLSIIGLSLVGVLPKSGSESSVLFSSYQNTVYVYGFNHPNFLGSILCIVGIELIFLYWDRISLKIILIDFVLIITSFLLGANTAAIGGLLFLIVSIIKASHGLKRINIVVWISVIWISLLCLLSLKLAQMPHTNVWHLFNNIVTSRPALWSYYFSEFNTKWIGSSVEINTSVINSTFGNGILDGSFIYQVMYNGYFMMILLVLAYCAISFAAKKNKNTSFLWITFVLSLMAFAENEMATLCTNVFLVIIGYYQLPKKHINNVLSTTYK